MLLPGPAGFVFSLVEALIFGAEPGLSWTPVCFLTDEEIVLRFLIDMSPVLEFKLGDAPLGMGPLDKPWPGMGC